MKEVKFSRKKPSPRGPFSIQKKKPTTSNPLGGKSVDDVKGVWGERGVPRKSKNLGKRDPWDLKGKEPGSTFL